MPKFALLLPHAPSRYEGITEDEMLEIVKDYVAWTEELSAEGVYVDGQKLADDAGKTLTRRGGGIEVHDSPFAELAEVLGGIITIRAEDYDAAVTVAKTCPHLVHNTTLHVRQLDAMEGD